MSKPATTLRVERNEWGHYTAYAVTDVACIARGSVGDAVGWLIRGTDSLALESQVFSSKRDAKVALTRWLNHG